MRQNTSRRDVLKASLALLASPAIVPSAVLGQKAPSNRINLAAIGTGGRGSDNCRYAFFPQPDAQFIAACDVRKANRERFARAANENYKREVCKTYADFREVLAIKDVDAVVVSTPDHWHVPIAYFAAKAKKDAYIEKPLSISMAWSWKLRQAASQNKIVFQYGTQQRGDQQQFRRACELVRAGYIGDIKLVECWSPDMSSQFDAGSEKPYGSNKQIPVPADFNYDMWIGPAPMKPYTADRCTCFGAYHIYDYALGFIAGWGSHPMDIAQWGLNADHTSAVKYEGTGKIPPKGSLWDTLESWDVNCTYANGVVLRNMGHRVAEPIVRKYRVWRDHGTTFHGSKGWISVDRGGLYASDKALQTLRVPEDKRLTETPSHARNFLDCIRSRKPTLNPLESAIRSDTMSHLGDISIRLGRVINWDPDKEQIVGDDEATKMLARPMRQPWELA